MHDRTLVYRERRMYMRARRLVNVLLASIALCAAAPLLLAAIVVIVAEDGFPVVFRQRRIGKFERPFVMYKLRTMRKQRCADDVSPTDPQDARITRVGRWLRKTSIDELPQLVNVIRGDMSLVGPRPEMPFIVERYAKWQHLRHLVEPGLTCIWQISARSNVPLALPEATMMDLDYIEAASPLTDGLLLARTFKAVFSANGAF